MSSDMTTTIRAETVVVHHIARPGQCQGNGGGIEVVATGRGALPGQTMSASTPPDEARRVTVTASRGMVPPRSRKYLCVIASFPPPQ